jgi:hypothetical protein
MFGWDESQMPPGVFVITVFHSNDRTCEHKWLKGVTTFYGTSASLVTVEQEREDPILIHQTSVRINVSTIDTRVGLLKSFFVPTSAQHLVMLALNSKIRFVLFEHVGIVLIQTAELFTLEVVGGQKVCQLLQE